MPGENLVALKEGLAKSQLALDEATKELRAKEDRIAAAEAKGDDLGKELKQVRESHEKLNKEHDEIMLRLQTGKILPGTDGDSPEAKRKAVGAHIKFIRNMRLDRSQAMDGMDAEERELVLPTAEKQGRSINVSDDTAGGVFVVPEFSNRIIDMLTQVSQIRPLATVLTTGKGSMMVNGVTGKPSGVWVNEVGARAETAGLAFKRMEIKANELYLWLKPTWEMLEDADFALEAWLQQMVVLQSAAAEGSAFITGNGVGKPRGLLAHPEIETLAANTGVGTASGYFASDDVIDLQALLPTEYANPDGTVVGHRQTMKFMRKFKDDQNRPLDLVQRDILAKGPGFTVDGYRGMEMPDMAQPGTASALLLGFANIRAAYTILDRMSMVVIRDPYSSKSTGMVDLVYRRRVGGDVVLPAAVKVLSAIA